MRPPTSNSTITTSSSHAALNPNLLVQKNQSLQQQLMDTSKHLLEQQEYLQNSVKAKKLRISHLEAQLEKERSEMNKVREENRKLLSMHELLEKELLNWKERYRNLERESRRNSVESDNEQAPAPLASNQGSQKNSGILTQAALKDTSTVDVNALHSVDDFFSDQTIRHILSDSYPEQARLSEYLFQDSTQSFMKPVCKNRSVQCELLRPSERVDHHRFITGRHEKQRDSSITKRSTFLIQEVQAAHGTRSKSTIPSLPKSSLLSTTAAQTHGIGFPPRSASTNLSRPK